MTCIVRNKIPNSGRTKGNVIVTKWELATRGDIKIIMIHNICLGKNNLVTRIRNYDNMHINN
jgi:hypothetical protein